MVLVFEGNKAIIKTDLFSKVLWIGLFLVVVGVTFYLYIFVWQNPLNQIIALCLMFALFFWFIVPYYFLRMQIFYDNNLKEWHIIRPRMLLFFPIGHEEIKVRKKLVEIKPDFASFY